MAIFSNPLPPEFCEERLLRARRSRELNLLKAGLVGAETCNSCEPGNETRMKLINVERDQIDKKVSILTKND